MSPHQAQELCDLNNELLHANLEMLREVRDYCRRNGLPSPVLDNALSYRVRQILDLVNGINGTPDERKHRDDFGLPDGEVTEPTTGFERFYT